MRTPRPAAPARARACDVERQRERQETFPGWRCILGFQCHVERCSGGRESSLGVGGAGTMMVEHHAGRERGTGAGGEGGFTACGSSRFHDAGRQTSRSVAVASRGRSCSPRIGRCASPEDFQSRF